MQLGIAPAAISLRASSDSGGGNSVRPTSPVPPFIGPGLCAFRKTTLVMNESAASAATNY